MSVLFTTRDMGSVDFPELENGDTVGGTDGVTAWMSTDGFGGWFVGKLEGVTCGRTSSGGRVVGVAIVRNDKDLPTCQLRS